MMTLTQAREALERAAVELDRADKQEVNRARAFDRATVELGEAAIDYARTLKASTEETA